MIKTESGYVSGLTTQDGTVSIFKGIPYASPPAAQLRWKAPQKSPAWSGVRECTQFSASAIQPPQAPFFCWTEEFVIDTSKGYSDDCLTLNIYCPSDLADTHKPVIVYIHGGNFVSGGSSCEAYNGEHLARHGVIFVTANFRVGILGLLASSELSAESPSKTSGNYQLLDQIAALQWVKNNIHSFGGDPENITLMGQSSGAAAVFTLSVSPMAKGLFRRVFAISHDTLNLPVSYVHDASGMIPHNLYEPLSVCEHEGDSLGLGLEHLRTMPPDELLKLPEFHPYCIDGRVITGTFSEGVRAGLSDDYDFMVTYTKDEPMIFAMAVNITGPQDYEPAMRAYFGKYADRAMTLYPFKGDAKELVFRMSGERYIASVMMLAALRKHSNTWLGEFDRVTPGFDSQTWGAFHTSDVPYWLDYFSDVRKDFWREDDYALGKELAARLAAFAKTGRPNAENLAEWKPSDGNSLYRIDAGIMQEVCPLEDEKYQFWRDFYCVN